MKILTLIILLFATANILKAEDAHLTKEQVKQITTLVAKGLAPGEPKFEAKTGTWTCSAGSSGPCWGIVIEIRDKDGYYRHFLKGKDFEMATSLRRRIAKIVKSKG